MIRIASLLASATEFVSALGWQEHLVARSHECDYPPAVLDLPVCTRPRFEVAGSSAMIDEQVSKVRSEGGSLYEIDASLLDRLEPTVVITQAQCEVCAVAYDEVESVCRSLRSRPELVTLEASRLAEVWTDLRSVARALGVEDEGRRLAARLESRIDDVRSRVRLWSDRPTVACVEWIDPLVISGNWVPELVEQAGGRAVLGRAGQPSNRIDWEQLVAADPDAIVLMPCGFDIERTRQELSGLSSRRSWNDLSAVRNSRVYLSDGNQFFNRSGPRLVESIEIMAEILGPHDQPSAHHGTGWVAA